MTTRGLLVNLERREALRFDLPKVDTVTVDKHKNIGWVYSMHLPRPLVHSKHFIIPLSASYIYRLRRQTRMW